VAEKSAPRKPLRKRKKAWQRPTVKTGRLFESNSLACGKNSPGMQECQEQNATQS
jgi:hypothetical protein